MTPAHARDILLVEDDQADAILITEILEDQGRPRSITQVDDGAMALSYLRAPDVRRPDVIVLDLNMPRMNGHELLVALKNDQELLAIPVVVFTTSSADNDVLTAYGNHANAYVTKPLSLDDFTRAVQRIDEFFLQTVMVSG